MTSRMWGTTLDTIVEMEVVLPDGTVKTVTKTQNPDLFWVSSHNLHRLKPHHCRKPLLWFV